MSETKKRSVKIKKVKTTWGGVEIVRHGIKVVVDSSSLRESEKVATRLMRKFEGEKLKDNGVR